MKIPLTLSDENRLYLVRSYQNKALESLQDAHDLLESKPSLSARMSYEAAYHSTVSLFICSKIPISQTHRGLNSKLYTHFVDNKLFSRNVANYLGKLENDRNTSQYNPIKKISLEDAKDDLQMAKSFYKEIQKLLEKRIKVLLEDKQLQIDAAKTSNPKVSEKLSPDEKTEQTNEKNKFESLFLKKGDKVVFYSGAGKNKIVGVLDEIDIEQNTAKIQIKENVFDCSLEKGHLALAEENISQTISRNDKKERSIEEINRGH
jgi:uncharacterized protein (UPF0332 family)